MEDAIVDWVNTFEGLPFKCHSLVDLADGVLLYKILEICEAKHFPGNGLVDECKGNAQLKERNLERLTSCMEIFFEDLKDGEHQILTLNLHSIAFESDKEEIQRLVEFAMLASIQSEKREQVVKNIMSLDEENQQKLMVMCEAVMQKFSAGELSADRKGSFGGQGYETPEKTNRSQSFGELLLSASKGGNLKLDVEADEFRLREENQELLRKVSLLTGQIKILEAKDAEAQERMQNLNEDLEKERREGLRSTRNQRDEKTTELQREVQMLKHDKADLSESLVEFKEKYAVLKKTAGPQISSMKKSIAKLQDELDVARSKAQDHAVVSSQLERYKERLLEMGEMRKKLKDAQEAHENIVQRNLDLEDQARELTALKEKLVKSRKELHGRQERVEELETLVEEKEVRIQELDEDVEKLRESKEQCERKLIDQQDQLQRAEMQIREGAQPDTALSELDDINDVGSKEQVMRLEREVFNLKKQLLDIPQLKEKLESAESQSRKYRIRYESSQKQLASAKSEMKELRAKLKQSESASTTASSTQLKKMQELLSSSDAEVKTLREKSLENSALKAKIDRLIHELDQEKERTSHLTRQHEQEIESIKAEQEGQQSQQALVDENTNLLRRSSEMEAKIRQMTEEMAALRQAQADHSREPAMKAAESKLASGVGAQAVGELKSRNIDLRQKMRMLLNKVKSQRETIDALQGNLEKQQLRNTPEGNSLALREMQKQLRDSNENVRRLERKLKSVRDNFKKEQLLISNAFYAIGLEAHNQLQNRALEDITPEKPTTKKSWLAKQRAKSRVTRS